MDSSPILQRICKESLMEEVQTISGITPKTKADYYSTHSLSVLRKSVLRNEALDLDLAFALTPGPFKSSSRSLTWSLLGLGARARCSGSVLGDSELGGRSLLEFPCFTFRLGMLLLALFSELKFCNFGRIWALSCEPHAPSCPHLKCLGPICPGASPLGIPCLHLGCWGLCFPRSHFGFVRTRRSTLPRPPPRSRKIVTLG